MTPTLRLHDGHRIPKLGFGLWQLPPDQTGGLVNAALESGYRMLDGASIYGNEAGLGQGIRASGLPREEVFVTTKVWNEFQGFDSTLRAVEESLARIGVNYLDLCLIHWPAPRRNRYVETWKALIRLQAEGRIRSIGVSNFNADHLARIEGETGVRPVLNQIELNPRIQQAELRALHAAKGIVTQSWTPLGQSRDFDTPEIATIAARLSRSPAQVILRWHLQLGCSVIPRSSSPARIVENFRLFEFDLSEADMASIARLQTGERCGPDPKDFE